MKSLNHIFQLTEEENQKIVHIVAELQQCVSVRRDNTRDVLFADERDWVVVMRCLIDAHILSSTPQRPPISDFWKWLTDNGLDKLRVPVPSVSTLSRTYTGHFEQAEFYTKRWNFMTTYLQRKLDERFDCSDSATK